MADPMSRAFLYRSYYNDDQASEFVHMANASAEQVRKVARSGLGNLRLYRALVNAKGASGQGGAEQR